MCLLAIETWLLPHSSGTLGWRQVVADSATPWGSQFHHFPGGNEQLAAEAVTLSGHRYEQFLRAALHSSNPADAVANWIKLAAAELEASS